MVTSTDVLLPGREVLRCAMVARNICDFALYFRERHVKYRWPVLRSVFPGYEGGTLARLPVIRLPVREIAARGLG